MLIFRFFGDDRGLFERVDWQTNLNHLAEKFRHAGLARNCCCEFVHAGGDAVADAIHIFSAFLHVECGPADERGASGLRCGVDIFCIA